MPIDWLTERSLLGFIYTYIRIYTYTNTYISMYMYIYICECQTERSLLVAEMMLLVAAMITSESCLL